MCLSLSEVVDVNSPRNRLARFPNFSDCFLYLCADLCSMPEASKQDLVSINQGSRECGELKWDQSGIHKRGLHEKVKFPQSEGILWSSFSEKFSEIALVMDTPFAETLVAPADEHPNLPMPTICQGCLLERRLFREVHLLRTLQNLGISELLNECPECIRPMRMRAWSRYSREF